MLSKRQSKKQSKKQAMVLHVDQKEKGEKQALVPFQKNALGVSSDISSLSPYVASEAPVDVMLSGYDIAAIQQQLPNQRGIIERYSNDEFSRQGDPFLKGRQESLVFIKKEKFRKTSQQTCDKLALITRLWEDKFEAELTGFLQDSVQRERKALEEHHTVLKDFQKIAFEEVLASTAQQLELLSSKTDSFRKTLVDLLQKKSCSEPIGCDLHTLEVASEKEVTLKFSQDNYSGFLPLLIRQRKEGSEDKVWIYGHKRHLKLQTIEALTPLTPTLYQALSFGTDAEPMRLEQEDWLTPIYHDIVNKNGHFTSISAHFFEEMISELAKALPVLKCLNQEYFFSLTDKFEQTLQRLKHYWQKEAPDFSFLPALEDQETLLALLKETALFFTVLPNLEKKIQENKEINEGNFFTVLKELQEFTSTVSVQIPQRLIEIKEAIRQEKLTVAATGNSQQLCELLENAEPLNILSEKIKLFQLQLNILVKKYPESEREGFLPCHYVAKLEGQSAFLVKFKKQYVQLSEKIKTIEIQLRNSTESLFLGEEKESLEKSLLSQVDIIKKALYAGMYSSGTAFFAEALSAVTSISVSLRTLGLIEEHVVKTIEETKQEWDALQAAETRSFLILKDKYKENPPFNEIPDNVKTFRETLEYLIAYLRQHKAVPESKEFIEGKAQWDTCLADWKTTELYKKISEISAAPEEIKTDQEAVQEAALVSASFEASLLACQRSLQKSSAQIAAHITLYSKEAVLLDTCFTRIIKTYRSQLLSVPLLQNKLSNLEQEVAKSKEKLTAILQTIFNQLEYTQIREIDVQEQEVVEQLSMWQSAKEQYKTYNCLLPKPGESKAKEEVIALQAVCYVGSGTYLTKLENLTDSLTSLQQHYLLSAQKGLDIIKANNQRLEMFEVRKEEILSTTDIATDIDKMKSLIQKRTEEVQSVKACIKRIVSEQATISLDLQAKTELALGLHKLIRSTYAKFQLTIHNLYCLNREIDIAVNQQRFYARQIDTPSFGMNDANTVHALMAQQETLSAELHALKQKKKSLLEGDVAAGIPAPGTLATLVFELKSELDRLVGKNMVDKHYWHLQKICFAFKPLLKKDVKTETEDQLIFENDTNKHLFESHMTALKEAAVQMRIRVEFVNTCLKETQFSILLDKTLTPQKYLAGLLQNMENLQCMVTRFECQKTVDPIHFAKKAFEQSTVPRNPLEMAFWSQNHEEARKQFLTAHSAALQARNFSEDAEEFFSAREAEALFVVDSQIKVLKKHKEALILQTKQHHQNLREQHAGSYATVIEAERNKELLLQYPVLLEKRDKNYSKVQQHKYKVAAEISGAAIKPQAKGGH
jgi:hypothetical protein